MKARTPASDSPLRRTTPALPGHTRAHNRALVLQILYRGDRRSRADIARETGLTRVTISDLISELQREGLVVERGVRAASGPGKPAVLLEIARGSRQIVAIDLSGHESFRAVLTDLGGDVLDELTVPSSGATGDDAAALVDDLLEWALRGTSAPVLGVGVGVPGIVERSGRVRVSNSLGWRSLDLGPTLSSRFGIPVFVANDANVAVLAEHSFGGGSGDMMLVKIDRGVGGGLLLDGRPVHGSRLTAGEIGRVLIETAEGRRSLESLVAAPVLRRAAAAARVEGGDADDALRSAGALLGVHLAPVAQALGIEEIVLTGPTDLIDGAFLEGTAAELAAGVDPAASVRLSTLGRDIVLRGAGALVLSERLGIA